MQEQFQNFIINSQSQTPILEFIINLIFTGILSFLLGKVYARYGKSLSNRIDFSKNFILISLITMLIISIVKSSLALSLGLVGALSIIRFRAAIKEPEELTYIFFCITIGLGFGANQGLITTIAYIIILIIIAIDYKYSSSIEQNNNLFLTISTNKDINTQIDLNEIVDILNKNCNAINLQRYDSDSENLEISFRINFDSFDDFTNTKNQLIEYNKDITIRFFDNKGIY